MIPWQTNFCGERKRTYYFSGSPPLVIVNVVKAYDAGELTLLDDKDGNKFIVRNVWLWTEIDSDLWENGV